MNKNSTTTVLEGLVLIGQLGFTIAIPIVLGYFLGSFLDSWLHAGLWLKLVCILLGLAAGIYGSYRLITRFEKSAMPLKKP